MPPRRGRGADRSAERLTGELRPARRGRRRAAARRLRPLDHVRQAPAPPLAHPAGAPGDRPRRRLRPPCARDLLARRRVRQRQVDHRTHHRRAPGAARRADHLRGPHPRRHRAIPVEDCPARDPARPPEPGCLTQSPPTRAPDRGSPARAVLRTARKGPPRRRGTSTRGRAARRLVREPLPGPALGRRAPARRDRPRACRTAAADALRRDPVRSRRVGADEHRRAPARAPGGSGDRVPLYLARPRRRPLAVAPGRRALPRRALRGRLRPGRVRAPVSPVYAHASLGRPGDRGRDRDLGGRPHRSGRRGVAPAQRVPVRGSLPVEGRAGLRRGGAAVAVVGRGSQAALPLAAR